MGDVAKPGEPQSPTLLYYPGSEQGFSNRVPQCPTLGLTSCQQNILGGREKSLVRAQASEEGRGGREGRKVCLVSDPRAWGCLGMGGGDMKGLHGALRGRGFWVSSLPGH